MARSETTIAEAQALRPSAPQGHTPEIVRRRSGEKVERRTAAVAAMLDSAVNRRIRGPIDTRRHQSITLLHRRAANPVGRLLELFSDRAGHLAQLTQPVVTRPRIVTVSLQRRAQFGNVLVGVEHAPKLRLLLRMVTAIADGSQLLLGGLADLVLFLGPEPLLRPQWFVVQIHRVRHFLTA